MADNKEAKKKTPIEEKRLKQSKIRNKRNMSVKRAVKTAFKKADMEIAANGEEVTEMVRRAVKAIDTASSKGIIKKKIIVPLVLKTMLKCIFMMVILKKMQ